jgi:hypothetical protein
MAKSSTSGQGRPKGVPNKVTKSVREAFERAFTLLQEGDPQSAARLENWAKLYPTEFYKLASKLIPSDVNAHLTGGIVLQVVTGVPDEDDDLSDIL